MKQLIILAAWFISLYLFKRLDSNYKLKNRTKHMKKFIFRRNGMYDMTVTITAINEDAARYIFEQSVISPQYYRLDN